MVPEASVWRPRTLAPTERLWRASAVLAGLRTASNDPLRAAVRHRGETKNRLNDVQGAFGELVALRVAERTWESATVRASPMDWNGPIDDVDMIVRTPTAELRFETKTHLDEPQKRLFLINDVAHARSVTRGAVAYLPIISAVGAGVAYAGRLIETRVVDGWRTQTFPSRPEADPARAHALDDLAPSFFDKPWTVMRSQLSATRAIEQDEIWRAFDRGRSAFGDLRAAAPDWNALDYERLVSVLDGIY